MLSTARLAGRSCFKTCGVRGADPRPAAVLAAASSRGRIFLSTIFRDPTLEVEDLRTALIEEAPLMAESLSTEGYYYSQTDRLLDIEMIQLLRDQCIALRSKDRFEPSWSETIVPGQGAVRFDKEGVFACEPDGQDYEEAPDLITYMSVVLQTLPTALNQQQPAGTDMQLSNASFNAKLAVTLPGGSTYPLHVDNPQGLAANDIRKLTCILYLNPTYQPSDGGELRLMLGKDKVVDVTPEGGRLVVFWSDEIPHEVLPTAPHHSSGDTSKDRYALTIWIPTDNMSVIHNASSPFSSLHDIAFPSSS